MRRKTAAREVALQALYAWQLSGADPMQEARANEPASDCCDTDSRAHPGGLSYTTPAVGCSNAGGFDFDCSGSSVRDDTSVGGCINSGTCAGGDRGCSGSGWAGSTAPACGQAASYRTCGTAPSCNPVTCPGCEVCGAVTTTTPRQACR